jgi:hypothetical protein
MKKNSLIRKIYLYSFSLLGLVLLIISSIRFLDMGLKAFVFTKAEEQEKLNYYRPPMVYSVEKLGEITSEEVNLSEEQKQIINEMIIDYQQWKEETAQINFLTSRRHREASSNLAMILIGLPLYLYHWFIIKKEEKLVVDK